MQAGETKSGGSASSSFREKLLRSLKISLLLFGLAVSGVTLAVWLLGDHKELPFEYEGFD